MQYEIREGGAGHRDDVQRRRQSIAMDGNWYLSGSVCATRRVAQRQYSYAMHRYYTTATIVHQSQTTQSPFKVTASTTISFYLLSNLGAATATEVPDSPTTRQHLAHARDVYGLRLLLDAAASTTPISAAGISAGDTCSAFVANFEYTSALHRSPATATRSTTSRSRQHRNGTYGAGRRCRPPSDEFVRVRAAARRPRLPGARFASGAGRVRQRSDGRRSNANTLSRSRPRDGVQLAYRLDVANRALGGPARP